MALLWEPQNVELSYSLDVNLEFNNEMQFWCVCVGLVISDPSQVRFFQYLGLQIQVAAVVI
jgi:hypothetical protein